ncbi:hypothetical protein AAC387_Pa06g1212 [Persea americana]
MLQSYSAGHLMKAAQVITTVGLGEGERDKVGRKEGVPGIGAPEFLLEPHAGSEDGLAQGRGRGLAPRARNPWLARALVVRVDPSSPSQLHSRKRSRHGVRVCVCYLLSILSANLRHEAEPEPGPCVSCNCNFPLRFPSESNLNETWAW